MKRILILVGPTASGKTAVACEIAKKIPIEMISCDSMQVYRGMPIVSQSPTAAEKKLLRAHLVSSLAPSVEFNAARFRTEALKLIPAILHRKRVPLIVGGTGLYLRALLDGIFEDGTDSQNDRLRKKLLAEHDKHGSGYLHDKLKAVDPPAAAKIHPNDARRLVRALEVFHTTGKPISSQQPNRKGIRNEFYGPVFFLDRDRTDLYARIHERVDVMLRKGLVSEVKKLSQKKLSRTASMALGIREMTDVIQKKRTRDEAIAQLKQNTRNYAKRQLSWFRHEKGVVPIAVAPKDEPKKIAAAILRSWNEGAPS